MGVHKCGRGKSFLVDKPCHTNQREEDDKNKYERQNCSVFHLATNCQMPILWCTLAFPRKTDCLTFWATELQIFGQLGILEVSMYDS